MFHSLIDDPNDFWWVKDGPLKSKVFDVSHLRKYKSEKRSLIVMIHYKWRIYNMANWFGLIWVEKTINKPSLCYYRIIFYQILYNKQLIAVLLYHEWPQLLELKFNSTKPPIDQLGISKQKASYIIYSNESLKIGYKHFIILEVNQQMLYSWFNISDFTFPYIIFNV